MATQHDSLDACLESSDTSMGFDDEGADSDMVGVGGLSRKGECEGSPRGGPSSPELNSPLGQRPISRSGELRFMFGILSRSRILDVTSSSLPIFQSSIEVGPRLVTSS